MHYYIVHATVILSTQCITATTVNDKSFEGEKFCGLLGSSGMQGKVSRFFPSPPSCTSELSEEQKFSRENFRGLKICENRESFLTAKLLSFTVYCAVLQSIQQLHITCLAMTLMKLLIIIKQKSMFTKAKQKLRPKTSAN